MSLKRFSVLVVISLISALAFFGGKYLYSDLFVARMLPKETLMERAKNGDAMAQFEIAYRYKNGTHGEQNAQKAFIWYQKSAAQNNAWAQNNLGVLYRKGLGTEKDLARAFDLFKKAAAQGNDLAKNNLAALYYNGLAKEANYTPDYDKAFPLFLEQAEKDHTYSQFKTAYMYENGEGTDQDFVQAAYWYTKAAENDNVIAHYNLAILYHYGKGVSKDYLKAGQLYKDAADGGNEKAKEYYELQRRKCAMYTHEQSCLLAADSQDARIAYGIGVAYETGEFVNKDLEKAAEWYLKAAQKGNLLAQFKLREAYYKGRGVTQDPIEGYAWDAVLRRRALDSKDALNLMQVFTTPETMKYEALDRATRNAAKIKATAYIQDYGQSLEKAYFRTLDLNHAGLDEYPIPAATKAEIKRNKAAYEAVQKDDFHHKNKAFEPPDVDFDKVNINYKTIHIQRIKGGIPDLYCDRLNCNHRFYIQDGRKSYKNIADIKTHEVYKANCLKDSFLVFAHDAGDKPIVSLWRFEDQQLLQATQADTLDIKTICTAWLQYKSKMANVPSRQ